MPARSARLLAALAAFSLLHIASASAQGVDVIFQDDFNRPDSAALGGPWTEANEVLTPSILPDGRTIQAAYLELSASAMGFHYVWTSDPIIARPYAYAPLTRSVSEGTLTFTYTPHQNGRVSHDIGLMSSADGFVFVSNVGSFGHFEPKTGVGVAIGRTDATFPNSDVLLLKYENGVRTALAGGPLPFQFDIGTTYTITLNVQAGILSVQISNGTTSHTVSASLGGFTLPMNQVFVADFQGGVSFASGPGDYVLRFDDVTVTTPTIQADYFLHANGPTLFLDGVSPTAATAQFKDSAAIKFAGGNLWAEVGTWAAAPTSMSQLVNSLSDLHGWLGLKNSDDVGTRFDLRAEVLKNGTVVASGETRCIDGVVRNANLAKEVAVPFGTVSGGSFAAGDVLSLRVLTRIGTIATGASCGGHASAVGLRLYFDAVNRAARFGATLSQ